MLRKSKDLELDPRWPRAAFVTMMGVAVEMLWDNPMISFGVMLPMAILIGIALADVRLAPSRRSRLATQSA